MKLYKALPVLSVLFAFVLSISCVSVLGIPAAPTVDVVPTPTTNTNVNLGTRLISVTDNKVATVTYDLDKIYRVLSLNRVFGSAFYDDAAVAESAVAVMGNTADAQSLACALYGRRVEIAEGATQPATMSHDILNVKEKAGLLTVTSAVVLGDEKFTAVTTLAPCQNEYGYMIISADKI